MRPALDRPAARGHAADGRQGLGARQAMDRGGRAHRCPARGVIETDREAEEAVERIGLPGHHQGVGGRRRPRHEDRREPKRLARAARGGAHRGARPGSATRPSTSSATWAARATSRSRCSATASVPSRSASASARSSAATRSWSRRRRRWRSTTQQRAELLRHRAQGNGLHRLQDRRHAGVPARRGQQLLLHGDEHPHPGRAHRHRGGVRRRPGARADPPRRRRPAAPARRPAPARPRDRAAHQRRGPGHLRALAGAYHRRSTCRAGWAFGSTPTSTSSTWCLRTTIRCWPSSSSTPRTGPRRWPACAARWPSSSSRAARPTWIFTGGCWPTPTSSRAMDTHLVERM